MSLIIYVISDKYEFHVSSESEDFILSKKYKCHILIFYSYFKTKF